jgi:PST family polysaccharide transporter
MLFQRRAWIELSGVAGQAAVSLTLAATGAGVWSLVLGQLAGQLIQTAVSWCVAPIRPHPRSADWQTLRRLAGYGRFVTAGNVVALFDGNLDTVTVGRIAGPAGVGFYGLAWRLANLPATGLGYIVGRVMLPVYSAMQHDLLAFREAFLTNCRRVALISLPLSLTLLLGAHAIVVGIFGPRWEPAVILLEILSVFGLIRSFSGITGAVFQASGRPQIVFYLSSWHLVVLVASIGALAPFYGVEGLAIAMTISALASAVPAYVLALRILDISLGELITDLVRPVTCSAPVALAVAAVAAWGDSLRPAGQIALLVTCVAAAYGVSLATVGRAEIRLIRAAFRT